MTVHDIAAQMRQRFTPTTAGEVVKEATITAEEWTLLAKELYRAPDPPPPEPFEVPPRAKPAAPAKKKKARRGR